jgi:hypothetical protein
MLHRVVSVSKGENLDLAEAFSARHTEKNGAEMNRKLEELMISFMIGKVSLGDFSPFPALTNMESVMPSFNGVTWCILRAPRGFASTLCQSPDRNVFALD